MVNIIINGIKTAVKEDTTLLEAARGIGVEIPTLCFLKDINEIGACRVCLVEIVGEPKLVTACNTRVSEGMEIKTESVRVREARTTNVRLILSNHNSDCPSCRRNGNCALQSLARKLNITDSPYEKHFTPKKPNRDNFPLIRDESKCIKCMRCINVCDKIQSVGVWDIVGSGVRTTVGTEGGVSLRDSGCTLCGQCIAHCPVAALTARDDTEKAFDAIARSDKKTVVQLAPAVRTAWAEELKLPPEKATVGRLISAVRALGFDYVFDTDFSADLTVIEETNEFLKRFGEKEKHKYPLFTSCCPGWVSFINNKYPELVPNLSSAKSPQQMFGAVIKGYLASKINAKPEDIFSVSVMPCVAKKGEAERENINSFMGGRDVDCVLTTRELSRMILMSDIDVEALPDGKFDMPFGEASGAGVIFGASGGVAEAALRTAYFYIMGKNPGADMFEEVRGADGIRELTAVIGDVRVRLCVASGLSNAATVLDGIISGERSYDFVEIMACPGGCAGGGGQPIHKSIGTPEEPSSSRELAAVRGQLLYKLDHSLPIRCAHDNPAIKAIYDEYYKNPLSEKAHRELHC